MWVPAQIGRSLVEPREAKHTREQECASDASEDEVHRRVKKGKEGEDDEKRYGEGCKRYRLPVEVQDERVPYFEQQSTYGSLSAGFSVQYRVAGQIR